MAGKQKGGVREEEGRKKGCRGTRQGERDRRERENPKGMEGVRDVGWRDRIDKKSK